MKDVIRDHGHHGRAEAHSERSVDHRSEEAGQRDQDQFVQARILRRTGVRAPLHGYHRIIRRWLLLAVAFPLTAWLLDRLADELAMRRGEGPVTRALRAPKKYRAARAARH